MARFVDTNLLLYSVSSVPAEAKKTTQARTVLMSRDLVFSVQVFQEFYVQATRPSRAEALTHTEAVQLIEAWSRFPVLDVSMGLLWNALSIKARYQLSYWDAAVIAAAKAGDCTEVLSEDMNAGQDYGGVVVVNPFTP